MDITASGLWVNNPATSSHDANGIGGGAKGNYPLPGVPEGALIWLIGLNPIEKNHFAKIQTRRSFFASEPECVILVHRLNARWPSWSLRVC